MMFLVQSIAFRRGIPEVSGTLHIAAADCAAALEQAKGRVGTGVWPRRTDALRVMDEGGRSLCEWRNDPSAPFGQAAN
jgi:hypothetical protein